MVNYLDELATKRKRWWGFWVLAPVILLSCVSMTLVAFDREGQTTLGRTLIIAIDVVAALLLLGLWDARRFYWCFRLIGLMVFLSYAWYIYDEFAHTDHPFFGKPGDHTEQSPINSLLGFAIIGIPALIFAVRPGAKPESRSPESSADTGESRDHQQP